MFLSCLLCHRDLPQYGHKQWQSYFGRTFDVYTKLWKFQQQHRSLLTHHFLFCTVVLSRWDCMPEVMLRGSGLKPNTQLNSTPVPTHQNEHTAYNRQFSMEWFQRFDLVYALTVPLYFYSIYVTMIQILDRITILKE